jgi:hypothetical protein
VLVPGCGQHTLAVDDQSALSAIADRPAVHEFLSITRRSLSSSVRISPPENAREVHPRLKVIPALFAADESSRDSDHESEATVLNDVEPTSKAMWSTLLHFASR